MKEQLISLETAKLAKLKGFKELCFHYYSEDGLQSPYLQNGSITDTDFTVELDDLLEQHNNSFHNTESAPTQSLLQKWLRDKHNIHIHLEYLGGDSYYAESTNFNAEITYVMEQYTGSYEYVLETLLFITLSKMN